MSKIEEVLQKFFELQRVIFWYDEKGESKDDFENLHLDGVEKVLVEQNPFEIKYLVNRQHSDRKFLLYFNSPKPANEDNWLLDMELSYQVFHNDRQAMFLQEMELGFHLKDLVEQHLEFFKSKERRLKLKDLTTKDDGHRDIRYKMLSIIFGVDNLSLSTFILSHIHSFVENESKLDKDLVKYGLHEFYWNEIENQFGYQSKEPGIFEFFLLVFEGNFPLGKGIVLRKETKLVLAQWRDSLQFRESYQVISSRLESDLKISSLLDGSTMEVIMEDELFQESDKKLIHEMHNLLLEDAISADRVKKIIKTRESKFWFAFHKDLYMSLWYGAELISLVKQHSNTTYKTLEEGVKDYKTNLYIIDQNYRKFIWHYRLASHNRVLAGLYERVKKVYSNDWLLEYNNNWQKIIDSLNDWPTHERYSQQRFFTSHVKPILEKKQRLFVVISDALRYECGEELHARLLAENRYQANLEYMVASVPTYTQLGMASLLPTNKRMLINPNSDTVWVDEFSATGLTGRTKILETNAGVRATGVMAEDFMAMNSSTEGRNFVKNYDLIYIYHNVIDKRGDDKTSQETVFEGVEDEIKFLIDLVKKIGNMNGNNIFITSDHGFIYQHHILEESDFTSPEYVGEIWKENRRFVMGRELTHDTKVKKFTGAQLNLNSDLDVLIPKSINRIRIKGSGSRFVHGGTTPQEIIIPLLKVNRKREDTTKQVDIDIIQTTDRITTNTLSVSFIQSEIVNESVLPRQIRAGLYAEDGTLLSDHFKFNFDISEGSERQRVVKHGFLLSSKASEMYKNQRIKLKLEEPIDGTTRWKEYKVHNYTLSTSYSSDFDDF
ncbi:BREX-1 system phosphatase PglZ type A [Peijinzhouia sedimentorum]